jgi:hypothetical protein
MDKGKSRRLRILLAGAALMAVTACTNAIGTNSEIEQGPVGVGRSINELKGTPCACTEIPMEIPTRMKV